MLRVDVVTAPEYRARDRRPDESSHDQTGQETEERKPSDEEAAPIPAESVDRGKRQQDQVEEIAFAGMDDRSARSDHAARPR